ncbi:hypothetical protein evm_004761 [Chilo suppressalis]|nr:hypothetical protein evm_004761 [Chilo suppressalis]
MPGNEKNVHDGGRVRRSGRVRTRGGRARGTRGGPRGARGGPRGARGGARGARDASRGGVTSRPQVIEESSCRSSTIPDSSAAPQPQPSTSSFISPDYSGANSPCFIPSPASSVECGTTTSRQNRHSLSGDEIEASLNYGSEEEEDDDLPNYFVVPRTVRMLLEKEENSPIELEAAGWVDASSVECGNTPTTSRQNPHSLSGDEIQASLNYGSEEEEDDDLPSNFVVPRTVRMLLEKEEDSPIEMEAAGRVDAVLDGEVEGPNSLFDFNWVPYSETPICPVSRRDSFVGQCGPTRGPIASAYEAFVSIWDRPIMDHIVQQTNKFAHDYASHLLETGQMGPNSWMNQWRDTTVDELYTFFAIMIAMSVVKKDLRSYWNCTEDICRTPGFAVYMSFKRFQLLSRCLHFNNDAENINNLTPAEAKLSKIKPIVDHLNEKFQSLYDMGQNISLDESLTHWKGPPNKAAHVDIQTYEICDSRSGYLWRFEVHAGTHISEDDVIPGQIPSLVLQLVRGLEHRGHTIWMDNHFNSPSLARVLKTRGFDCVGTLRTNRQFVPDQIKDLDESEMRVGEVYGCTSGDVDIVVWRYEKRLALVSTYHGATVSDGIPTVIKDYSVCMGEVDEKDQMLVAYPMERSICITAPSYKDACDTKTYLPNWGSFAPRAPSYKGACDTKTYLPNWGLFAPRAPSYKDACDTKTYLPNIRVHLHHGTVAYRRLRYQNLLIKL